jgi:hypothetical protein
MRASERRARQHDHKRTYDTAVLANLKGMGTTTKVAPAARTTSRVATRESRIAVPAKVIHSNGASLQQLLQISWLRQADDRLAPSGHPWMRPESRLVAQMRHQN